MKHILCFGDSNTWGYDAATYDLETGVVKRMPCDVRWTGLVQQLLGGEYLIIENALNGRTLLQDDPYFPGRLGIKSLEEALDVNAPLDLVVLHLGVNELKHMFNLSAGMISYGLERMIQTARQEYYGYPSPRVLIIAPPPVRPDIDQRLFGFSFGPLAYQKSLEFSGLCRSAAERYGCGFIDCAALHFTLNDLDGLHYSREDHAKLAPVTAVKIREMLE
jgi:lysophospholipase L1-like esterase